MVMMVVFVFVVNEIEYVVVVSSVRHGRDNAGITVGERK